MDTNVTDTTTTAVVLEALKSAAEAHGQFEAEVLHGEYDIEWPHWYAEHITAWLRERDLVLSPRTA